MSTTTTVRSIVRHTIYAGRPIALATLLLFTAPQSASFASPIATQRALLEHAHLSQHAAQAPVAIWAEGTGAATGLHRLTLTSPPRTYADLPDLPRRVDLSRWDMPPADQGFVGSCAAWATTYSLTGWWAHRQQLQGAPFAPMASYHLVTGGHDMGSMVVANMIADMRGMVPQAFYGQGNFDYTSGLTAQERRIGGHFRVKDWYAVYEPPTFDTDSGHLIPQDDARHFIERSLARGVPVVISLTVFRAIEAADSQHFYVGADTASTGRAGAHAVFADHYDAHGLWIENEWGLAWGRHGYAELSWDFVNRYVDSAMAIAGLSVDRTAPGGDGRSGATAGERGAARRA